MRIVSDRRVVIVAGTNILPQWLRFAHWKRWMSVDLVLWAVVVFRGLPTYCAWYVAPLSIASVGDIC